MEKKRTKSQHNNEYRRRAGIVSISFLIKQDQRDAWRAHASQYGYAGVGELIRAAVAAQIAQDIATGARNPDARSNNPNDEYDIIID